MLANVLAGEEIARIMGFYKLYRDYKVALFKSEYGDHDALCNISSVTLAMLNEAYELANRLDIELFNDIHADVTVDMNVLLLMNTDPPP